MILFSIVLVGLVCFATYCGILRAILLCFLIENVSKAFKVLSWYVGYDLVGCK
jgi:hypothetical protein